MSDFVIFGWNSEISVVFGSTDPPHLFDLEFDVLDGTNGFRLFLNERTERGFRGITVADVTGDGKAEILVPSELEGTDAVVVIGSKDFPASVTESDFSQLGFTISHPNPSKLVPVGDINNDGIGDIAIQGTEAIDVMFGKREFATSEVITGAENPNVIQYNFADRPFRPLPVAAGPGDVNGDGIDDLLLGNSTYVATDRNGKPLGEPTGEVYVIYGGEAIVTTLNDLPSSNGLGFTGHSRSMSGDQLGSVVSQIGDFNGDGTNDLFFTPQEGNGDHRAIILYGEATASVLPGDANGDGSTNFQDFLILANNFGKEDAVFAEGDFDGDGRVSFLDFLVLAENFGKSIA